MWGTAISVHDFNVSLTCSDIQESIHFYAVMAN
jgi:hypothetical protein